MLSRRDDSTKEEKLLEKTQLAPVCLKLITPSDKYTDAELAEAISKQLIAFVKQHPQSSIALYVLCLSLGPESIRTLSLFMGTQNVISLNVTYSKVESASDFYELMKASASIKELRIKAENISVFMPGIDLAIKKNILKTLNLGKPDKLDMLHLSVALMNNCSLQELDLQLPHVYSHECSLLMDALSTTQLKKLILNSYFPIKVLAELLAKNPALEFIYIDAPNSDEDLAMLIRSLKQNTHLKTLNLWIKGDADKSLKALADCLKVNKTLESMHFIGAHFSGAGLQALQANGRVTFHGSEIHISKSTSPTVFFAPPPVTYLKQQASGLTATNQPRK